MSEEIIWSASKLGTVMSCDRKTFFDYVERVESPQTLEQAFGDAVHCTIEALHARADMFGDNPWLGVPKWEGVWATQWREKSSALDWSTMKLPEWAMKRSGFNIVQRYAHQHQYADVIGVELEFDDVYIGRHRFRGKIDQIRLLPDGRLMVVDMKTSKLPPNPLVLRTAPQFTIYDQAVKQKLGVEPILCLLHLKSGELVPTERTDADIPVLIEMVEEAERRMVENEKAERWARNLSHSCTFCNHKARCLGGFMSIPEVDEEPPG